MPHRVRTLIAKLLLVAFGLVLVAVGLALAEGVLGILGVGDDALYDDPFVGFAPGANLFERTTRADGTEVFTTRQAKLAFFNRQEFPAHKTPDAFRVFALGGSTTYGRPYDDRLSFARWLERYLDAAEPGRQHEVINAGAISYASYRVALLMRELVRYQPNLFVIYTGHNEFLEERTYSDIIHQPEAIKRLRMWLSRFRLAALLRRAVRSDPAEDGDRSLTDEVQTRLDVWTGLQGFHRDLELTDAVVEHFGYNLDRMVVIARDHGAEVILVRPISNLKDFSPFKSEHAADISDDDETRFQSLLAKGSALLSSDEPRTALRALEEASSIDPEYAEVHYRIGQARLALDETEDARIAFVLAKDLDVAPLRALESLVECVDATARRLDVPVIDLPQLLEADSRQRLGHTILGNRYLLDHVHPDTPVHSLIAERIVELLASRGEITIDRSWSEERRREIYDDVIGNIDREYYAQRDLNLAKVLGWAGKLEEAEPPLRRAAEVLHDDFDLHLTLGTVLQKTGKLDESALELEHALTIRPSSAVAHFNLGVVFGRQGRLYDGIAELEEAVRLQPDYAEAHHNLGVLYRRAEDPDNAIAALERALVLRPDAPEVHHNLGLAYRLAGRTEEALTALDHGMRLGEESGSAHAEIGVTLAELGRLQDAEQHLHRAIRLDPGAAEAHYNLGLVLSRLGRGDDAMAAYSRCMELDPDHARASNNLGILLAGRGELDDAKRLLIRATKSDPRYAEAYLNLGVVYDRTGDPLRAISAVERAVELAPQDPRNHLALGLLYLGQRRVEDGLDHLSFAEQAGLEIPPEAAALMRRDGR